MSGFYDYVGHILMFVVVAVVVVGGVAFFMNIL
jgi:hypothetical protein